jgi:hypothetical protein
MSIFRRSDHSNKKDRVKKVKLATQDKTSKKLPGCSIHGSRESVAQVFVENKKRNVCQECLDLYTKKDEKHPPIFVHASSL